MQTAQKIFRQGGGPPPLIGGIWNLFDRGGQAFIGGQPHHGGHTLGSCVTLNLVGVFVIV